jgi:SAM-dependent methyltransferase
MKPLDEKLHKSIHNQMLDQDYATFLANPRLSLFKFFERKFCAIKGTVLDVGAGSGYASIYLALNHSIKKALALESSIVATSELIPKNVKQYKVGQKVFPLLGSFSDFCIDEKVDFVFSFGSLHHSDCLFTTFQTIGRNMRAGAYLLAQEPVMNNKTSNKEYFSKYECEEERYGIKMKNGERNDRFYREAEYIAAACFSGFDLVYQGGYNNFSLKGFLIFLKNKILLSSSKTNKNRLEYYTRKVKPTVWVFRKHDTNIPIAHLWNQLK